MLTFKVFTRISILITRLALPARPNRLCPPVGKEQKNKHVNHFTCLPYMFASHSWEGMSRHANTKKTLLFNRMCSVYMTQTIFFIALKTVNITSYAHANLSKRYKLYAKPGPAIGKTPQVTGYQII